MRSLDFPAPVRSPVALYIATALAGMAAGVTVSMLPKFGVKLLAVGVGATLLPLVVLAIGSLRNSLLAILTASMCVGLDVNPLFNDKYMDPNRGIQITAVTLILVACLGLLFWRAITRRTRLRLFPNAMIPLGIVLLATALSATKALYPMYTLRYYPLAVTCVLIVFYAANFIVSRKDLTTIATWITICVGLSSALALAEWATNGAVNLQILGAREEVLSKGYGELALMRVSGTFGHPNALSIFLNAFMPIVLVYGLAARSFRLRLFCLGTFMIAFVTLILTFTRAGWAAFILSALMVAVFFAFGDARRQFRGVWLKIGAVGAIVGVLAVPFVPHIVVRLTQSDLGDAEVRIPLALTALKIIEANPILGIGLGNYKESVPSYDASPRHDAGGRPNFVHNFYLHTAAEIGVPALMMFLWTCAVCIYRGFRCLIPGRGEVSLFAVGALAGLLCVLAHGMVEPGTYIMMKFVWIHFLFGLLLGVDSLRRAEGMALVLRP